MIAITEMAVRSRLEKLIPAIKDIIVSQGRYIARIQRKNVTAEKFYPKAQEPITKKIEAAGEKRATILSPRTAIDDKDWKIVPHQPLIIMDPIMGDKEAYESRSEKFGTVISVFWPDNEWLVPVYSAFFAYYLETDAPYFEANSLTFQGIYKHTLLEANYEAQDLSDSTAHYFFSGKNKGFNRIQNKILDTLKCVFGEVKKIESEDKFELPLKCGNTVFYNSREVLCVMSPAVVWDVAAALHLVAVGGGTVAYLEGREVFPMSHEDIIFESEEARLPNFVLCGTELAARKFFEAFDSL